MATRQVITSATAGEVTGDNYMDNVAGHISRLLDAAAFPLTSVAGTGNAVTAALDPVLLASLVTGMKFTVTWAAANTGGVTLALNGGSAVPVLDALGGALAGSTLAAGKRSLIEYVAGSYRILSGGDSGAAAAPYFIAITASITWVKPTGFADNAQVLIEAWGGGGGGLSISPWRGGGGGAYVSRLMRYADLPPSVTVTIGAGGSIDTDGGNTTFGALATAYGGSRGSSGHGAGPGSAPSAGGPGFGGGTRSAVPGPGGIAIWPGGGGGGGTTMGGASEYGGGGGGGSGGGSGGGVSLHGGNGGGGTNPGVAPGGGGGGSSGAGGGPGARGEVRVWIG